MLLYFSSDGAHLQFHWFCEFLPTLCVWAAPGRWYGNINLGEECGFCRDWNSCTTFWIGWVNVMIHANTKAEMHSVSQSESFFEQVNSCTFGCPDFVCTTYSFLGEDRLVTAVAWAQAMNIWKFIECYWELVLNHCYSRKLENLIIWL